MKARPARGLAVRQAAFRRGRLGETICVWSLRLRGWRIVARGWRVPVGEIDIIARRGAVVAAIEVKARDSFAAAAEAVSPRQQRRVTRAFAAFLANRPDLAALAPRFDVMLIVPRRWPRHLPDAWRDE